MDIVPSVLAYLGCITGIVGALALSFAIFVSTPNHLVNTKHLAAMTAKQSSVAKEATSAAKLELRATPAATVAQSTVASQTSVVVSVRQKAQASRAQYLRRMVQEERARRWAYQQDPDFEARFLGYAD